jgi:arsenate reductase-like glutaredoxin family protein
MTLATRDLFKEPLAIDELARLATLAPGGVRSLLSTRSAQYKALGLHRKSASDRELLALMAKEPRLIRRPLVVIGRRLIIGSDQQAFGELG